MELASTKARDFTQAVTSDDRWELEDEILCQVFGYTLYGYLLGVGRLICFMDVEDIQALAAKQLVSLGIGPDYASGMMEHAHEEFMTEGDPSLQSQLVEVGHSHATSDDMKELVESIFENAEIIRNLE